MKIQLTIPINFISARGNYEIRVICSKRDNIEDSANDKADEVIEELSNHFFLGKKLDWKHQ